MLRIPRILLTAVLCGAAVLVADTLFRRSIVAHVRPLVLTPVQGRVYQPPVEVHWEGPAKMRVLLRPAASDPIDLGLRTSPTTLPTHVFPRDGSYTVELYSPRFPSWIYAQRQFEVFPRAAPSTQPTEASGATKKERTIGLKEILRAIKASRAARERANERLRSLAEENAVLREESEKLLAQLESLSSSQDEDSDHIAQLERELDQLRQQNRAMSDELQVLRLRLGTLPPCTVWGYYSFPRPNTYPATRRVVVVSDSAGRIFRSLPECELGRRVDPTAGSPCFCTAGPWG
ncbi:MAG: hypothetical protein N3C12_07120 [Candidatus Binatia bacterium]|nr:hypothetical protein [Candidatus Binatia bacterium]